MQKKKQTKNNKYKVFVSKSQKHNNSVNEICNIEKEYFARNASSGIYIHVYIHTIRKELQMNNNTNEKNSTK